jgi:large subunit ribosomal protein L28
VPFGKSVQSATTSATQQQDPSRFLPNLQDTSVLSDALNQMVRIKVSTRGLKTIEHNGGLDAYLTTTNDSRLTDESRRLKRRVEKALAAKAEA